MTIHSPSNTLQFIFKKCHIDFSHQSLKWGAFNVCLLSLLLFDISNQQPFALSTRYYVECFLAAVVGLSVAYNFAKYFYLTFTVQPIHGTVQQRELLQFKDGGKIFSFLLKWSKTNRQSLDSSFITTSPTKPTPRKDANSVNVTSLSWHSSMNDSNNRNLSSSCWAVNQLSPQRLSMNNSFGKNASRQSVRANNSMNNVSGNLNQSNSMPFSSPYKYSNDRAEVIADEKDMQQYLR